MTLHKQRRPDGADIAWRLDGPPDAPPLVLLNSIGTDLHLWDGVVAHLRGQRLLRIDTRGHGHSDAPPGDYTLPGLAADVIAVMQAAGLPRAPIAGVSLGGMVALQLALIAPDQVEALALICTSAQMDSASWAARVHTVRREGMAAIADLALQRFFTSGFAASMPEIAAQVRAGLLNMNPDGYAGCAAAIRDMDLLARLPALRLPVLVIVGTDDVSTPYVGHGDILAERIPGAQLVQLPCGHLAPLEAPEAVANSLAIFLGTVDGQG